MARIGEDLLLLLLDNASSRPALDRARRERLFAGAVLLDLAYACRLRPAVDGEPAPAGRLLVLAGPATGDPILDRAVKLLGHRPTTSYEAVARLGRRIESALLGRLEQTGQIRPIRLRGTFTPEVTWPINDRSRVDEVRAAVLSALFEGQRPSPPTAAVISLLHAADGLGALLSLNESGWRWVHARAGDIAAGTWLDGGPSHLADVNLAATINEVRHAVG